MRQHLENAEALSAVCQDYFSAILASMEGDSAKALTIIENSKALAAHPNYKGFALLHSDHQAIASEVFNQLFEQPLGFICVASATSYGAACGLHTAAHLRPLTLLLEQAHSTLPSC